MATPALLLACGGLLTITAITAAPSPNPPLCHRPAAAALAPSPPTDDDDVAAAQRLLCEGRFAEARSPLEARVAAAPADPLARCLLACACVSLGDAEAALAQANAATLLAPTWASPWYQRGRALLLHHDFRAADRAFTAAKERDASWESAWRDHFQALAALGVGDEARARTLWANSPEAPAPGGAPFLFERMASLWSIVPDPEPARGWYRRAAHEWFGDAATADQAQQARRQPFELAPPVHGEWRVMQGHFGDESHFGIAGSWSLDLMKVEHGKLTRRDGDARDCYFTDETEVVAPADGTVVRAVDTCADHAARASDRTPLLAREITAAPLGNHLVLELAPDAYLLLAHLQRGSLTVKVGDRVAKGRPLAAIGMTGVTYAPHLHLTLWSQLAPPASRPLRFLGARRRGRDGTLAPTGPFVPDAGESIHAH